MQQKKRGVMNLLGFTALSCVLWTGLSASAVAKEVEVVAVAEPWPPFMGPELENQGFLPELVNEVLGRVGYKVKLKFLPWARVIKDVEAGSADMIYAVYYTKERERFLKFSPPIAQIQDVFFSKKGRNITYRQLSDLKPYQIGVVRGAAHGKEFDESSYLNKDEVVNSGQNIEKLMAGRIDLLAAPKEVLLYRVKKEYPQFQGQLEVVTPPINTNKVHIGFSKNSPRHQKLHDAFVKGLNLTVADGTFNRIAKKHGIDPYLKP